MQKFLHNPRGRGDFSVQKLNGRVASQIAERFDFRKLGNFQAVYLSIH